MSIFAIKNVHSFALLQNVQRLEKTAHLSKFGREMLILLKNTVLAAARS